MEVNTQRIHETTTKSGDVADKTTQITNTVDSTQHRTNVLERVVWFVVSVIEALLVTRLVLALLGANVTNTFADFIYTTSNMFVSPFSNLFSYDNYVYGVSRFEGYTVVAMLVYLLAAVGIVKLVTLNRK